MGDNIDDIIDVMKRKRETPPWYMRALTRTAQGVMAGWRRIRPFFQSSPFLMAITAIVTVLIVEGLSYIHPTIGTTSAHASAASATITPSPLATQQRLVLAAATSKDAATVALPTNTAIPTATSIPTSTTIPTATPIPTSTPVPTDTPKPTPTFTPIPDTKPGTILNSGQTWREKDVLVTAKDFQLAHTWYCQGHNFTLDINNEAGQPLVVAWDITQMSAVDNLGRHIKVNKGCMETKEIPQLNVGSTKVNVVLYMSEANLAKAHWLIVTIPQIGDRIQNARFKWVLPH